MKLTWGEREREREKYSNTFHTKSTADALNQVLTEEKKNSLRNQYTLTKVSTMGGLHYNCVYTHLCIVLSLYTSLDSQHLPEGVLVAVANFELLPRLPVGLARPWVTHLRSVTKDPSSTIDLTELCLQLSILQAHLPMVEEVGLRSYYSGTPL